MFPYIGGKAHHIRHLDRLFPIAYDTFVDVFGGAGWVSVKSENILRAKIRVYNDYNPHLANIFYWFKTAPTELRTIIESWPQQNADLYRKFQQEIFGSNPIPLNIDSAAKYLYLEVQSFTGNTLSLTSSVYFDKKNIHGLRPLLRKLNDERIVSRLQSISHVENLDCVEIIRKYDSPTSFFYVDPPYYEKEHYYTQAFGRDKHKELAECLGQIQGQFALSYYEFPELLEWFPENRYKHNRYTVSKQNSSRTNKQRGTELVITN